MQISRRHLTKKVKEELEQALFQLVADIKSPTEAKAILATLLTEAELVSLVKRLGVSLYLKENKSYSTIKRTVKVSSATIAGIKTQMDDRPLEYETAFEKIEADRWSRSMSKKISGFFKLKSE